MENSIFRSRLKLSECGVPDLIQGLMGKTIGTKVAVKLNGIDHVVELLAIRKPPKTEQVPQQADTAPAPAQGNA